LETITPAQPGIEGAARVVCGEHAFGEYRPGPRLADPGEISPRHHRPGEHRAYVRRRARTLAGKLDVGEEHRVAIREELHHPARPAQEGRQIREHAEVVTAHQIGRTIVQVALAVARGIRIDGHGQDLEPGLPDAGERRFGHLASAREIELIPQRRFGPGRDGFAGIAREARHTKPNARLPGCRRHGRLALRMEQTAEPDGRQQKRHRQSQPRTDTRRSGCETWTALRGRNRIHPNSGGCHAT
jgi:hypothetical protein